MLALDRLLSPVSAARACGEDLTFSSDFDAIAKARLHDDPSLDQGAWVVALKEADWPFVAARCAELIESTSKDLRLAVWLAEAQAKTRQFRGLGDGFALLAGLCRQYWDELYPLAEEGDYEQRIGNLFWLLARAPQLIREVALTEGRGSAYSTLDFDAARLRALKGDAAAGAAWGGAPAPSAGPTLAALEAARRANSRQFSAALLADAEYCLAALQELEQAVDARLGSGGPGFSAARQALHGVLDFIRPQGLAAGAQAGSAALQHDADPGVDDLLDAQAPDEPMPARGFASRRQALAQLRLVAEFFRRTEPHSPVAYLADKAADWGELPLHLWLRAVVKDAGAIAQLEDLLGSAPGATEQR